MNKKTSKSDDSSAATEDVDINEEINDNEEMLFELDECLHTKTSMLDELKEQVSNLENDVKRYSTPYNVQKTTLESDVDMFKSIASKYVKKELIDFYVDRMRKSASNALNHEESTISALCNSIVKEVSVKK